GLAKPADYDQDFAGPVHTNTGDFVGSLPWASPEQVQSKAEHLDIRTDVYSLGVMLFHSLTGRPPYEASGSLRSVMENICYTEPPRPSSFNREIGDELDAIVLKCLRKRADDRYQSAGEVSRELQRYLNGDPVQARSASGWYVLRKAIRRHRGRAAVAAL